MKTSLIILAIVANSIVTFGQSRIGSGDQGVQGLLAASTQQIIPGDEVVVPAPAVPVPNEIEKIVVTTGDKNEDELGILEYCVSFADELKYKSIAMGTLDSNAIKCRKVGRPIYIQGNKKLLIQFNGSFSFFEKKANEGLIIKLGKIKLPKVDYVSNVVISNDLDNPNELDKVLFLSWVSVSGLPICSAAFNYKDEKRIVECEKNYLVLKEVVKTSDDGKINIGDLHLQVPGIDTYGRPYGGVYALPGVYKVRFYYKNGEPPQELKGIVLR